MFWCTWLLVLYTYRWQTDTKTFQNMSLKYNLDLLQGIGQGAKLKANLHLFSLKYELRMKIIGLDIRKRVRLYRSSRAGKRLHYRISPLMNKPRLYRPGNRILAQRNNVKINARRPLIADVPQSIVVQL